ncbi:MAG: YfhO family protein [Lachnospiraceae bacterium]|nr:YfhO family protein [Lachnospiraceae bacterium]
MELTTRLCKLRKNAASSLLPAFFVLLVFLGVLFIKGIFPFGNNLIDYYDMGQTNAPLYYHIWDFLHGRSALFFDWYINGGQNLSMGSAIQWNISPFNLFFLLIPRYVVYPSLSIFMGLHLIFMAFNMGLFLKYIFPRLPGSLFFISAAAYGLCGYTLTHYTIPTYLDTAVFLPLFAFSLIKLLRGEGKTAYTFMLAFMTALSYYLGFMHLIYVLLFSGVYVIILCKEKSRRRIVITDLAFGTLGGLLMSAFMLLPSVMQMTLSSRFNSNLSGGPSETLISILNSIGADEYYVKYLQLYALEFFVILIIIGIIRFRKERGYVLTVFAAVFIPCTLIVFESINILWHFGTYYHYPVRCGYLIPFSLIAAAASVAEKTVIGEEKEVVNDTENAEKEEKTSTNKVYIIQILTSAIISAAGLFLLVKIYKSLIPIDIRDLLKYVLVMWAVVYIMLTITLLYLFFVRKIRGSGLVSSLTRLFLPVIAAELILGAYVGYGLPGFTDSFFSDPEQSGEYIPKAEAFASAAYETKDAPDDAYRIERLKNPDTDLNANYGMVIRHATVGGWANTATREQIECAEKLGYSTHFMRILDSGGTLLTDSILQVKDILTATAYSDDISAVYEEKGRYSTEYGDYHLYGNKLSLPFAMAVPGETEEEKLTENSIAENNNLLYRALSGDDDPIAGVIRISDLENDEEKEERKAVNLDVSGCKALYMSRGSAEVIRINGKTVPVPTIGDQDNTAYPAWFNSNLLYLGIFEDETVELKCPEKSRIITIDINKLTALQDRLNSSENGSDSSNPAVDKAGLTFNISGGKGRDMALIPLSYSPGWSAVVNGKTEKIRDFGGMFMLIPIAEGDNTVQMKFTPPGLIPGIIISMLIFIIILSVVYIKQIKAAAAHISELLSPAICYLYYFIFALAAVILYVIPIGWTVVHVFINRLRG